MKKLILTTKALLLSIVAFSQMYLGQGDGVFEFEQIAPGEFKYIHRIDHTIYMYDADLSDTVSYTIPTHPNSEPTRVDYASRNLVDNDNGIEFIISYFDSTGTDLLAIKVLDDGVATMIPNFVTANNAQVIIDNLQNSSIMRVIFYNYGINGSQHTQLYTLPGKALSIRTLQLEKFKLFPNPASDAIKVPGIPGDEVMIFDYSGQMVKKQRISTTEELILLGNLTKGSYVVRTSSGGAYKFVKQ